MCQNVTVWITSSLSTAHTPTDIALGNFDGVHLGHQTVIAPILPEIANSAALLTPPLPDGLSLGGYSDRCAALLDSSSFPSAVPPAERPPNAPATLPTVLTFYPHPRAFFSGQSRPWLTPLVEKATVMRQLGVRQLILLPFNTELANLSPQVFVEEVLLQRLQARHISVGADFRFGHKRAGDVALLQDLAERQGVRVTVVPLAQQGGDRISSSRIRAALAKGDMAEVQTLMGRPYMLTGRVGRGQQLGRQLGFPTANVQVMDDKFLPRPGVYGVRVWGIPGQPDDRGLPGVMNWGVRPTVDGQQPTLEVHVLNWQGNLYGKRLTITLHQFLRPEQRFASLEHLKAQISADCVAAEGAIAAERARDSGVVNLTPSGAS